MDRRVKERLIGATILVVLIVLIVPELLSGPKRPRAAAGGVSLPVRSRSVSVDLATSKATTCIAPQARDARLPPRRRRRPLPPMRQPAPSTGGGSRADAVRGRRRGVAAPSAAAPAPCAERAAHRDDAARPGASRRGA